MDTYLDDPSDDEEPCINHHFQNRMMEPLEQGESYAHLKKSHTKIIKKL